MNTETLFFSNNESNTITRSEALEKLNKMILEKPSIELKKNLIILFYFGYQIKKNDDNICSRFLGIASHLLENGFMINEEFLRMHDEIIKVLGEINVVSGNTPENIIHAAIECNRNDILEKCEFRRYAPMSLKGFYIKMVKKGTIHADIVQRLRSAI